MNEKCFITFNEATCGIKTLDCEGSTLVYDIFLQFVKFVDIKSSLKDYMFLSGGIQIDIDTIDPSEKIINSPYKNSTILVCRRETWGIEEDIDKISRKEFKSRNCRNWTASIKEILLNMANYGSITSKLIENTLAAGGKSFMLYEEAINKKDEDSHLFILGILAKYLNNLGILTVIEKNYNNISEKYKNMSSAVLQFIFNGLISKQKYYLTFNFSKEKMKNLYKPDSIQKNNFHNNLIDAISKLYGITSEEIIVSNPIYNKYYLLIVIINDEQINLTKQDLMKKFQHIPDLCELISVEKKNIIDGIILNKCMLDPKGDNKDGGWGYYEKRGGEDYLPPEGWDRYGLNVYNKYDNCNNDWLSYDNRKGEWCIAYGWLTYNKDTTYLNQYENDKDIKHNREKVGKGIYCSQDPEVMEEYTEAVEIKGEKYKLGLMLRVNPSKIRCPENKDDLWVVDGFSDDIRPYGILIQKIE